ncbi:uncharacterized protein NECHADRAFT_55991 [Fusarium vanettenii 77-13-4]|uniref:Carboxylic ester hydrolase n=1 Tax=Fusarium vanettenii (strain ATCC MYA-4622 / CBS 123669 / FGSC 9596 / NRRL 45880 / 77-13-4) TaxID=660122 RepID=C7ZQ86_FUSV7|nr:uncharacterized protein NECHADRAFT_55991 [Fusarium vanettenii 77-13-4]EEU33815.1 hypothetical protein NECHADRAFT_55991 [Fusarium vanettenii 77-13-4]
MLKAHFSIYLHSLAAWSWLALAAPLLEHDYKPIAWTRNGPVVGVYHRPQQQEHFLGIPYAEPPTGERRFTRPEPWAKKWSKPFPAGNYGPFCYGRSLNLTGFDEKDFVYPQSEDCLTINVVRPSGCETPPGVPVLVWIYGGGFQEGGSGDQRYNMSDIVQSSVEMGSPIIGVSLNYRTSIFGFIAGKPFRDQSRVNLGIQDQRLALQWIQDNIHAFGGDPRRVTISGESAGALSVGFHLLANNGRDEGLFSGAIAESGGPFYHLPFASTETQDDMLESLLESTGCINSTSSLSCLQTIPPQALLDASGTTNWNPIVDHVLLERLNSEALHTGMFVRVPLLIGSNTNEGTPFVPDFSPGGTNNSTDFATALRNFLQGGSLSAHTMQQFEELYLHSDASTVKKDLGTVLMDPGAPRGALYGRISLLLGDLVMSAGRRISAEAWARHGAETYSYRFDTVPSGLSPQIYGAAHFQEVAFVFGNVDGGGYDYNPFNVSTSVLRAKYQNLSQAMRRMWINFVNTGTPNSVRGLFLLALKPYLHQRLTHR